MIDKETKREIRKQSRQEVWGSKKDVAVYIVSLFISSLIGSLITLLLRK